MAKKREYPVSTRTLSDVVQGTRSYPFRRVLLVVEFPLNVQVETVSKSRPLVEDVTQFPWTERERLALAMHFLTTSGWVPSLDSGVASDGRRVRVTADHQIVAEVWKGGKGEGGWYYGRVCNRLGQTISTHGPYETERAAVDAVDVAGGWAPAPASGDGADSGEGQKP